MLSLVPWPVTPRRSSPSLQPEREPAADKPAKTKTPRKFVPPSANKEGYLTIVTTPWTEVTIDGAPAGVTPLFRLRLPSGKHLIHLTNPEAKIDTEREVQILPGKAVKVGL
jgi:hypothetical protein